MLESITYAHAGINKTLITTKIIVIVTAAAVAKTTTSTKTIAKHNDKKNLKKTETKI